MASDEVSIVPAERSDIARAVEKVEFTPEFVIRSRPPSNVTPLEVLPMRSL